MEARDEQGEATRGSGAPLGRAVVAEAFGTFLLTFASVGALALAQRGLVPELMARSVTPGVVVLAMIYAFGSVSGAHINPAVTLAFAVRGAFPWSRLLPYWGAQFAAALAAGLLLRAITPLPPAPERLSFLGATLLEGGSSAVLLTVVLAAAHQNGQLKPASGLAVGATVVLGHLSVGLSAVSMNPARALGPALVSGRLADAWPHLLGPFLGGLAALLLIRLTHGPLNRDEREAAGGHAG